MGNPVYSEVITAYTDPSQWDITDSDGWLPYFEDKLPEFDLVVLYSDKKFAIDNLSYGEDKDEDGVTDDADKCLNTPEDEYGTLDANGCSASQRDSDGDEVMDDKDICPATPGDEYGTVDANGCSGPQRGDSDNDGVLNATDGCPNTPAGEAVDASGCSASQCDSDGDGVMDDVDNCISDFNPFQQDANGDGIGNACDSSWDKACLITKVQKAAYLCKAVQACYSKEIADKSKNKYNFSDNLKNAVTKLDNSWTNANKAKNKDKADFCYDDEDRSNAVGTITTAFDEIYSRIIDDPYCSDPSHNSDDDDARLAENKNFNKMVGGLLTAASKRCISLLNAKSAYLKSISKDAAKAEQKYSDAEYEADNAFYMLKNGVAGGAWGKAVVKAGKAKKPEVYSLDIPSENGREEIKLLINQLVEEICNM